MPYGHIIQYTELVKQAQDKRIKITKKQQREISKMYSAIAEDLKKQLDKYGPETLTYRWLKDYAESLKTESKRLYRAIEKRVKEDIRSTAGAVTEAERAFYDSLAPELSDRFRDVFSRIPRQVTDELMSGGIYRDFTGLSERIWDYRRKYDRDIQWMIHQGITAQKSAFELAKDLEIYLDPKAAKPFDWSKVYPGVNKKVDYSAQRLARTSVTHAYQLSFQRATKDNPFVEKYRWLSSNSARVCPLCAARNGQLFEKDSLPLDHPSGMCTVVAVISKSYEEIGNELADWMHGKQNLEIDRWLNPIPDRDTIDLTDGEEYALLDYISSKSYKINATLRAGIALSAEEQAFVRDLDSALDKIPRYQGTVFRSLSDFEIEDVNKFLQSYIPGEDVEFPEYLSTSTAVYDDSMPIQYVICSTNGHDIRLFNQSESEILFSKNSRFKIKRVDGHTIYLEEI